jgi:hypothetical protein
MVHGCQRARTAQSQQRWDTQASEATTRDILIGTGEGQIYKCLIEGGKEKYLKLVYALPCAPHCRPSFV